ncbi:MarP family serine protease [Jatrophihabitans sp. YIM 134969]
MIVDIVILLLVVVYAVNGFRNGALVGVFSLVGLAGGAYGGAQLAQAVADRFSSTSTRVIVALLSVLVCAVIGQVLLLRLGVALRNRVRSQDLRRVDQAGGALLGVVAVLLVAWMVAVPLANSTVPQVNAEVRESRIVRGVNAVVPAQVQETYRSLRAAIDQSGFPSVFGDLGPSRIADAPPPDSALATSPVVAQARGAVVKVNGVAPSCDRGLEGSGFVYATQHVLTNAHVVAGTDKVDVEVPGQGTLAASVVRFDPESDVAVLYVPDLQVTPLTFAAAPAKPDADALVLGYPEDGPFDVRAARVREQLQATGRDIYDTGSVTRSIYSIRALVRPGNSGGPLLDAKGQVLGIVFATAIDAKDTGFVLTNDQVMDDATVGGQSKTAVSTGSCTAG